MPPASPPITTSRSAIASYHRAMAARTDCRHYVVRTASQLEKVERCRLDVAQLDPFGCPEGCLFFEPRNIADQGWQIR